MSVREASRRTPSLLSERTRNPAGPPARRVGSGRDSSVPRGSSSLSLSTHHHYVGRRRSREFDRAPESVQTAFWRALGRKLAADRESNAALAEIHGVEVHGEHRLIEWDEDWRRRARSARVLLTEPERRPFPNDEIQAILALPAAFYVERLTGEELPRHRRVNCPSPDHEDRDPSCAVYENGWRCFACGASGNAYGFAGLMWDLALRGPQFVELHNRLKAVLA